MRPSLVLCSLLLCLGCARSVEPASRSTDAASAPTATAASDTGTPPAQTEECRSDADCTLTRIPENDCCPQLCVGRAVSVAEAKRLEDAQRQCEAKDGPCPSPMCARPRFHTEPVCTGGRCATRNVPMEAR